MPTDVTRSSATRASVPGVLFTTDSRPETEDEKKLQRIQADLSGGITSLPSESSLPQLALASVAAEGGMTYAVITLWVPQAMETDAATKLSSAGFTLL